MFFDSHLHFDTFHESNEVQDVLERAREAGVVRMMAIGGMEEANRLAIQLSEEHPETIGATVGYDRDEAGRDPDMTAIEDLLKRHKVLAIGETGLDYHYSPETAKAQQELFGAMLDLAHAHGLPTVVHSRDADEDTLARLSGQARRWTGAERRVGVLHCFTGSATFARSLLDLGIMISFSGIATFKGVEAIREAARMVPDDMLLIETDAPYLAPEPYRGKQNEPAYVVEVARLLADIRNCTLEHIAVITKQNAEHLFGLGKD